MPVRIVAKALGECCVGAGLSPDGTHASVYRGNESEVIDLDGNVTARRARASMWAEDSKHLCDVRLHDHRRAILTSGDLVYSDRGRNPRVVGNVGQYGPHANPQVMWCSASHDMAIVAEFVMGQAMAVQTVRLSTGVVSSATWAQRGTSLIAVSGDGSTALLRESSPPGGTILVDTATGAMKAHLGDARTECLGIEPSDAE